MGACHTRESGRILPSCKYDTPGIGYAKIPKQARFIFKRDRHAHYHAKKSLPNRSESQMKAWSMIREVQLMFCDICSSCILGEIQDSSSSLLVEVRITFMWSGQLPQHHSPRPS
jgi:hypothetical protein